LIEVLGVLAIIAILAVLITPAIRGVAAGAELNVAAAAVTDSLELARQTAISTNRPVEVRFFKVPPPSGSATDSPESLAYRALAIYQINDDGPERIGKLVVFGSSVLGSESETFGTLLKHLPSDASALTEYDRSGAVDFTYRYFQFRPDGSTNLSSEAPAAGGGDSWHVMLYNANSPPVGETPPDNHVTVQLDPVTGRTRTFQPG
jgi:uncharacterized protein (TIGR02596 family)